MEERFWSKVDKKESNEECWEWTKRLRCKQGYGGFSIGNKEFLSHRIAYELHYKTKIEEGLVIRHKCDNRICCNPYHLELGTQKDNVNDMYIRKRNNNLKGEKSGMAKLTETQVLDIKENLKNWKYGDDSILGREYNVDASTIKSIRDNKTWTHI